MLFLYAVSFSYAYLLLDTCTGALILFGSVQITIVTVSLFSGERIVLAEWTGLLIAFAGFVFLLFPGVSAPSYKGFTLMALAGTAWGIYTMLGKECKEPLARTEQNFRRTLPLSLVLFFFIFFNDIIDISPEGLIIAIASGGLASAMGYVIWYSALKGLSSMQSGVVQLLVPVLAASGGIIFLAEIISMRLVISATMVLGGILILFYQRSNV
jgi:drug/metabolite transporter (DMT)-like permease